MSKKKKIKKMKIKNRTSTETKSPDTTVVQVVAKERRNSDHGITSRKIIQ